MVKIGYYYLPIKCRVAEVNAWKNPFPSCCKKIHLQNSSCVNVCVDLCNYPPNILAKKFGLISNTILNKAKRNKNIHSVLDNLHFVLIKISVIINVAKRINTENMLSLNNIERNPALQSETNRQVDSRLSGAITELIQMIHKILKISDHITFPTPIS
jgi:hypothetical protein